MRITIWIIWAVLIAGILAFAVCALPAQELVIQLISRIRDYGAVAPVLYLVFFIVAAVIGISRGLLTIIAGVLFTPGMAFVVAMSALGITFISTFMIARYLAADRVTARLEKIPMAKALMSAVEEHGFRLIVLMRLNPFVPGVVNGYGFGLTTLNLGTYLVASLLGSLPLTVIYLYLGWAGGEAMLRSGSAGESLQGPTLVAGIVLSVLLLIGISWYGHRAVSQLNEPQA